VLSVQRMPRLESPVLVCAISGWVDSGLAGSGTVAALLASLESHGEFATLRLDEHVDLSQTRPSVRLRDDRTRVLDWPELRFVAGRSGVDCVVCHGPEPGLSWPTLSAEIVGLAEELGVSRAVMLGGMPVAVSHRRPVQVLATATARSLAQELPPLRDDYHGPTGFQTVLQVALGAAGIPTVALWAQVPHYLAGGAAPPAVRALLRRLTEITRLRPDLGDLDAACEEYLARVEHTLAVRSELSSMVDDLDADDDEDDDDDPTPVDELPSGDDLASEIERFLRGDE
jgi:proteasome assembly chaperone (PAC2) family protein